MSVLLEAVFQSTYAGQECINRFNYIATGTPAAVTMSFALTEAMGCIYDPDGSPIGYPTGTLFDAMRSAQAAGVAYSFVSVKDVYSVTDFYELPFVQAANGKISGDTHSPVMALGYRSNRIRSDIRRGMKRFVGIAESSTDFGGLLTTGYRTGLAATLGTKLGEVLSYDDEGNTLTFTPVIVGKERLEPDPPTHPNVRYKYYDTYALQADHFAAGITWQTYPELRSQTSRQYGRGR